MRRRPILSIIGDAEVHPGDPAYDAALEAGRLAIDGGYRILCGGRTGIMEAACRGAHMSSEYREGDTIGILPGFDPTHANPHVDISLATGLDNARNAIVANGDAVIAIGGGAGTLSEIAFAWTYRRLIVALRVPGWSGELAGRRLDARKRIAGPIEQDFILGANDAAEALALVDVHLPRYPRTHESIAK